MLCLECEQVSVSFDAIYSGFVAIIITRIGTNNNTIEACLTYSCFVEYITPMLQVVLIDHASLYILSANRSFC